MLDTELESVACNVCGADEPIIMFEAGVAQSKRIVRCSQCSLMYASPRRIQGIVRDDGDIGAVYGGRAEQMIEKQRCQVADYNVTLTLLNELHPDRGRMLEVGSSFGYHLAEFKKHGWMVEGIDPARSACEYSQTKLGVPARQTTLEESGYENESFDVVTMNHVIEHVPDPKACIEELRRIIRRGGHLVLETPTFDSLMFKIFRRRERSLSCEGHIYFFTPDTLRALYEQAGFKLLDQHYTGRTLTLNRLAWNVGVMSKSKAIQRALDVSTRAAHLQNLSLQLNLRDMVRVCLERI
jgi:2-polyprenyl-3-methyl-5-hydroxy-6-metoxy-1,4-benzoquinol methylase